MSIDVQKLQEVLCQSVCAQVQIARKNDALLSITTPFHFADGDPYLLFIEEMAGGVLRLSDMGHTMMHLSYENDIDSFRTGTRGSLFEQIKAETGVSENDGAFYIDGSADQLATNIFKLSHGLSKINDLTFLNRVRAESTFYDDLKVRLEKLIDETRFTKDYYHEGIENSQDYPIDYKIEGKELPLFLFGIPNKDKARLTTIILERLLRNGVKFDSLLVFADQASIPRADLARLSNAGGEMIASLDADQDLSRKLLRKVA